MSKLNDESMKLKPKQEGKAVCLAKRQQTCWKGLTYLHDTLQSSMPEQATLA